MNVVEWLQTPVSVVPMVTTNAYERERCDEQKGHSTGDAKHNGIMTEKPRNSSLSASTVAYWGRVGAIVAASFTMAATLPGRTHGLGIITTRLLVDFQQLSESNYAQINLVATLIGSLMCLPCGWLIDRYGMRPVSVLVLCALGSVVLWMSGVRSVLALCCALTLTRGIGQSMLSVVSLAIIGKSFPDRPGNAMGAYAVLLTFLMAAWTGLLGYRVTIVGWRIAWNEVGWGVFIVLPIVWFLTPRYLQFNFKSLQGSADSPHQKNAFATFTQAIATPCFWIFALGISLFGMISSGVSLFQQSILASRGFSEELYHSSLVLGLFVGMASNLLGGWLATKYPMQYLLSSSLMLLAASLMSLTFLTTTFQAYAFCVAYSISGGLITVLFFTVWGHAFGTGALAKIQGAAQMLTVLASSVGPLLVTESRAQFHTYDFVVWVFAGASSLLGIAAIWISVPSYANGDWNTNA